MSVNPDGMRANSGIAEEYVDLEHQVIRQKLDVDVAGAGKSVEVLPGDTAAEFSPGERQLDREEIAQLVYYRSYATLNFLQVTSFDVTDPVDSFAIADCSIGINGDLFRPVTTQSTTTVDGETVTLDTGGEIGLLDNYQLYASPNLFNGLDNVNTIREFAVDYYDWPTGGPIVDSFDTITAGFGFGAAAPTFEDNPVEVQLELRYDLYWDVAEQGRSTNPFGRPSTR